MESDRDEIQQSVEIEVTGSAWPDAVSDGDLAWLGGEQVEIPPSLPALVAMTAMRSPDDVAVRAGSEILTYRELVAASRRLARRIRDFGDEPGQVVLVNHEPGIEYAVAVLAAITARCHAAPLHPDLPSRRVEAIVRVATPSLVLGNPVEGLKSVRSWDVGGEIDDAPLAHATVQDPCYALFTSGSTGVPKGVRMHQLPVANLARFEATRVRASVGARTAQLAPLGFDVAFQEMFGTWAMGGELVTVPLGVRKNPARLVEFLAEHRITRLYCVPLLLRMIARASNLLEHPPLDLREIVTSGEVLRIDEGIREFGRACPDLGIINQLGAAETIQTTSVDLGTESESWPEFPDLGRPIPGVQLRVVSGNGEPLPLDSEGEIEIGGFGPAVGYLGDTDSAQFKRDDFGRWYRTGDRGKIDPEGRLVYLGRRDHQVKIRGFRIELGDVEQAFRSLPGVREAVVEAVESPSQDRQLMALIVMEKDVEEVSLLDDLRQALPPWMIPQRLRIVDSIPVGGNGKIDRLAVKRRFLESHHPSQPKMI